MKETGGKETPAKPAPAFCDTSLEFGDDESPDKEKRSHDVVVSQGLSTRDRRICASRAEGIVAKQSLTQMALRMKLDLLRRALSSNSTTNAFDFSGADDGKRP